MHDTDILREKYDDYQIVVKSAPYPSAIMSGLSHMIGFYTPGTGDILSQIE